MTFRDFLIKNQILSLAFLLGIHGCTTTVPKWDGKIWAGDSANAGITRAQETDPAKRTIKASDPAFDDYMAMSYADFKSFYQTYVLGCNDWQEKTNVMSLSQALEAVHAQAAKLKE